MTNLLRILIGCSYDFSKPTFLMPFDGGLELFLVVSTILNNNKTVGLPMTEGDKDLVSVSESFSEFKSGTKSRAFVAVRREAVRRRD